MQSEKQEDIVSPYLAIEDDSPPYNHRCTAYLYFWFGQHYTDQHVALEVVANTNEHLYISFMPDELFGQSDTLLETYQECLRAMRGTIGHLPDRDTAAWATPTHTLKITDLNYIEIEAFYYQIINHIESHHIKWGLCLPHKNCASLTLDILYSGGFLSDAPWHHQLGSLSHLSLLLACPPTFISMATPLFYSIFLRSGHYSRSAINVATLCTTVLSGSTLLYIHYKNSLHDNMRIIPSEALIHLSSILGYSLSPFVYNKISDHHENNDSNLTLTLLLLSLTGPLLSITLSWITAKITYITNGLTLCFQPKGLHLLALYDAKRKENNNQLPDIYQKRIFLAYLILILYCVSNIAHSLAHKNSIILLISVFSFLCASATYHINLFNKAQSQSTVGSEHMMESESTKVLNHKATLSHLVVSSIFCITMISTYLCWSQKQSTLSPFTLSLLTPIPTLAGYRCASAVTKLSCLLTNHLCNSDTLHSTKGRYPTPLSFL